MLRLLVICLVLGLVGCSADNKPSEPTPPVQAPAGGKEKGQVGPPVM